MRGRGRPQTKSKTGTRNSWPWSPCTTASRSRPFVGLRPSASTLYRRSQRNKDLDACAFVGLALHLEGAGDGAHAVHHAREAVRGALGVVEARHADAVVGDDELQAAVGALE